MEKNYYSILGLDKNATPEEIKKSYRKLAMEHHPDKNNGSAESEDKFKEIAEAYDVLSTPEKKSNYDRFGTANPGGAGNPFNGFNGGNPFGGGFDMGDIFSDLFGNRGGRRRQTRGPDIKLRVSLTIDDILNGVTKKFKYNRQYTCDPCGGKGGTDITSCPGCGGSGVTEIVQNTPFGSIRQQVPCNRCSGSGQVVNNTCRTCSGTGTNLKEEIVDANIPAGVSDGMGLTMEGFGHCTRGGDIPGNLIIIVEEAKDSSYTRENNNIIVDKVISVIDAIIGSNIKVNTPHGEISLVIEPGTNHGKIFRLKGKGIPDMNHGLGDMFIRISIKIPSKIDMDEKYIIEKLKGSKNFKV